ncbi:DcrB/PsbP domain-containing protein [Winogradskyella alexanderae]|uniref:PsbP C-terminal domain-containing protein n=1 Tax=Winogradskyella alexanderae TaxID=2877123 RepID=A0ABS7XVI1_9FLAO|nr:PsbP-related protein [Winogradskyella alexanderae]MCA0133026.1 hypothetical protein [Winogradskyella alexanderae]
MKTKVMTCLLLLASLAITAQENWKTLKKDAFAISYPDNWESSDQLSQPGMQFLLLSDESTMDGDKFREYINLTTESLNGQELTVEEYAKISLDQIMTQLPDSKIESNNATQLDGLATKEVVWSADFGNGNLLKFKQSILLFNGKAYILTFSSSTAEYDDYVKIADLIFQSFKLAK